jgi:hypothetical protein
MEFHIARSLRERLQLNDVLFSYTGNAVFANVAAARKLAVGLNELRGHTPQDPNTVNGGALFAMGLIDELSHAMVAHYRKTVDPAVLTEALHWFKQRLGPANLDRLLLTFADRFPGTDVFNGKFTPAQWLKRTTDGLPHRESELEELLLLWLANQNPAFLKFRELFSDDDLKLQTAYPNLAAALPSYFDTRPPFSKEAGTLIQALRAPMLAAPDSLTGQLEFMREHWEPFLGPDLKRALLAIDVVREEDVAIWMRFHPPTGHTPQPGEPGWEAQGFAGDEYVGYDQDFVIGPDGRRYPRQYASDHQAPLVEYEAFSPDQAWMPNVVMLAKSTYVWLEQLSQKYLRHIHRLDQIPDEELKILADRGMTALWLIGLWERSSASRTIKRLRGQADAVASAYSLKDYNIADDLGGNSAYESLRDRAAAHGIRLASDMVPNHMGIDSPWVIEHPEWFITRPDSPFPSYRFEGPDLSNDSRAEIKIEDHYYDQTDAAVAFRLRTYRDNQTHFMYHGNDGTTFAWNDTAQLDYSKASVREHVMQVILHVARLFPIIRFDAAMVLAKRHVQRLWFPLPGVGGSIPSRAENAMSQEEFDALMPNEFWREVVDRVAVEVPGTLLLAEAFWLLEGYFVRTLGMHRVYNSAFMNMLRDEENAKYRSYMKKTLEFDPDILKRYVNFMSNPDEKTAAEQFGSGDKHFGTCTLLATLPGLPMFAHGQVEGFGERYGMDFKQARVQETPDQHLIERYQREITPLLKNRRLFAGSEDFVLYDFWTGFGSVDENVIAYSNRQGHERAVILYNNTIQSTHGTIHIAAASVDKGSGRLLHKSLTEALALPGDHDLFVAYRDSNRGIEYLRRASDLRDHGLTLHLDGYQYIVLQNWREFHASAEYPWDQLHDSLNGVGVPNLDEALTNLRLRPLHDALRSLLSPSNVQAFANSTQTNSTQPKPETLSAGTKKSPATAATAGPSQPNAPLAATDPNPFADFLHRGEAFYSRLVELLPPIAATSSSSQPLFSFTDNLQASLTSFHQPAPAPPAKPSTLQPAAPEKPLSHWLPALTSIILESLPASINRTTLFDELHLRSALAGISTTLGTFGEDSWRNAARARILIAHAAPSTAALIQTLRSKPFWDDPDVRWLTGITESHGITYFNKESFEEVLHLLQPGGPLAPPDKPASDPSQKLSTLAEASGYQLDAFTTLLAATPEKFWHPKPIQPKPSATEPLPPTAPTPPQTPSQTPPSVAKPSKTPSSKAPSSKAPLSKTPRSRTPKKKNP